MQNLHFGKYGFSIGNTSIRMISVSRNTKKFSRVHANNTVAARKLKNVSIASETSSLNFNASIRAEQ